MGFKKKLEVAVGLEPTKVGFADRRLDRFGIATLYPNLYPKLYPNRPRIAYLPHTISLQVVDFACDRANEMVLQTIALPLGDRATALRSCQFSVISGPLIRKNNQESTELNEIWTGEARRECRFSPSSSLPCAASAALVNDRTVIGNAGSAKKFFEG